MATAVLENVNPYSKYGLKRRPTYNEIIGLINENETLTGQLPDRTATMFKASPEGSFFDGMDHLEVLKEQQNRIQERQMRELLLRQNLGGGTYHVERLRQQTREANPPDADVPNDGGLTNAQMQTQQLEERVRQYAERQSQTGRAHQAILSRTSTPSIIRGIFDLSPQSRPATPALRQPIPRQITPPEVAQIFDNPAEFIIATDSENDAMHTARGVEEEPQLRINYSTNISNMSVEALKIQLYLRGVDVDAPEYSLEGLRRKGRGKGLTEKQHFINLATRLIENGQWQQPISASELQSKITAYRNRNKALGSEMA